MYISAEVGAPAAFGLTGTGDCTVGSLTTTGPDGRQPALAEQDDAVPAVESLAEEMDRATRRLRSKAWMINAMTSGATAAGQPETPETTETSGLATGD